MITKKIIKIALLVNLASVQTSVLAATFDGCPSQAILTKFKKFGETKKMPPELGKWLNNYDKQLIKPWKPFDNVTYLGICWVSSWLIETDDGSILIDSLYGPYTSKLISNIEDSGVKLTDIKYVLMTHGHFDHAGGATTLKERLPNATFVMTKRGWIESADSAKRSTGTRRAWSMIKPEMIVNDGDIISLGNNTIKVHETPGHTWGTSSYSYDVIDGENNYRAITVGGLGLNAIEGAEQVEAYINSVDTIIDLVGNDSNNIQVHLTTHGFSANLEENRAKLLERKADEKNLFVDAGAFRKDLLSLKDDALKRLETEKNKTSINTEN